MSGLSKRLAKLEMDSVLDGDALDLVSWTGTGEYVQVSGLNGKPINRRAGEDEAAFMRRAQDEISEAAEQAGKIMPGVLWATRDGHDVPQPYPPPRPAISREEWIERFGNTGEDGQ